MELHPAEHAALGGALAGEGRRHPPPRRLEGALALAPMTPRRGLVLVDPSYEVKAEYEAAAAFVRRLVAKWPEVAVLVWYPLLPAARHHTPSRRPRPLPVRVDEVASIRCRRAG